MHLPRFLYFMLSGLIFISCAEQETGTEVVTEEINGEERFFTVNSEDGTQIFVERTGEGSPVLLVHGAGCDRYYWKETEVFAALEEQHTVYVLDRRGRAQSVDMEPENYDLSKEVADIHAVIETIGEPLTLIGHSYGALISLEASLRTDLLETMVLYEPPFETNEPLEGLLNLIDTVSVLVDKDATEKALRIAFQRIGFPDQYVEEYAASPGWEVVVNAVVNLPREYAEIVHYPFEAERFAHLDIPILLIYGDQSHPIFHDVTYALDEALPNSQVAMIEDAGHFAMYSQRTQFTDIILQFIEPELQ